MKTDRKLKVSEKNFDEQTVLGFGDEWSRFTQTELKEEEKRKIFQDYFRIFPWQHLPENGGVGLDIGCGSGRWATIVAPKVSHLHLVDASLSALNVARKNLVDQKNISFHHTSVDEMSLVDGSLDFAYSLGVLHHVPDTQKAIASVAKKLKRGAPFLIYLYYSFENRPLWFRMIWRMSNIARQGISRVPYSLRYLMSQVIAIIVYWPLARLAKILEKFQILPFSWPLAYYRDKSFYIMRTDSLDRFGTHLERRFTRQQIKSMLESTGFVGVTFSESPPYWCALGIKS